ncbi:MAG: hypothetical protein ACRCSN_21295 [Dermatophilaceae bacterium]
MPNLGPTELLILLFLAAIVATVVVIVIAVAAPQHPTPVRAGFTRQLPVGT